MVLQVVLSQPDRISLHLTYRRLPTTQQFLSAGQRSTCPPPGRLTGGDRLWSRQQLGRVHSDVLRRARQSPLLLLVHILPRHPVKPPPPPLHPPGVVRPLLLRCHGRPLYLGVLPLSPPPPLLRLLRLHRPSSPGALLALGEVHQPGGVTLGGTLLSAGKKWKKKELRLQP